MRKLVLAVVVMSALVGDGLALAQTGASDQAAYVTQCRRDLIATYPNARAQAESICASQWGQVVAAAPMAGALLAWAPAAGAAFDAFVVRPRGIPGVDAVVNRPPSPGVTLHWSRNGEPIPFRLEDALRVRGAALTMIGCMSYGAGEGQRVYRVSAPGKGPFALSVAFREAALASQSSDFSATADYGGRMPTLASLQRDGNDWAAQCPA
jgi:hypothetical protein